MLKNIIILSLYLFCAILYAQVPIRYTTKQGLPSNSIFDLAQDSDGFMWFATNKGLVKFDGKIFKTFTLEDGLPNTGIWKIESDFEGRIWYSSKSNQQGYIKNDSVYKFFTPNKKVVSPEISHKSNNRIWSYSSGVFLTLNDTILVKTFSKDINDYLNKLKRENLFNFNAITDQVIFNPEYKEILLIKKDEILVLNNNLKIQYRIKITMPNWYDINAIRAQSLLPHHTFFIASNKGVLFIDFNKKTAKFTAFKELIYQNKVNNVFIEPLLNEIQVSVKGHLIRFDYDFNVIEEISFPKNYANHRSFKDIDGNVWLADLSKGITLLPKAQLHNNYYFNDRKVSKINKVEKQMVIGLPNYGFYKGLFDTGFSLIKSMSSKTISEISYDSISNTGFLLGNKESLIFKNGKFNPLSFVVSGNIYNSFKEIINY